MVGPADQDDEDAARHGDALAAARARTADEPTSAEARRSLAQTLAAEARAARSAGHLTDALALAVDSTRTRGAVIALLDQGAAPRSAATRFEARLRFAVAAGTEAEIAAAAGAPEHAHEAALRCLGLSEELSSRAVTSGDDGLGVTLAEVAAVLDAGADARADASNRAWAEAVRWSRVATAAKPTASNRRLLAVYLVTLSQRDHARVDHEAARRHQQEAQAVVHAMLDRDPEDVSSQLLLFWIRLLLAESLRACGARLQSKRLRWVAGWSVPDLVERLRAAGRGEQADAIATAMRNAAKGFAPPANLLLELGVQMLDG